MLSGLGMPAGRTSYDSCQPDVKIPRKIVKGGLYLCAPNYLPGAVRLSGGNATSTTFALNHQASLEAFVQAFRQTYLKTPRKLRVS